MTIHHVRNPDHLLQRPPRGRMKVKEFRNSSFWVWNAVCAVLIRVSGDAVELCFVASKGKQLKNQIKFIVTYSLRPDLALIPFGQAKQITWSCKQCQFLMFPSCVTWMRHRLFELILSLYVGWCEHPPPYLSSSSRVQMRMWRHPEL